MRALERALIAVARIGRRPSRRLDVSPEIEERLRSAALLEQPAATRTPKPARLAAAIAVLAAAASLGGYAVGGAVADAAHERELAAVRADRDAEVRALHDRWAQQDVCLASAELEKAREGERAPITFFASGTVKRCYAEREVEVDRIAEEVEELLGQPGVLRKGRR